MTPVGEFERLLWQHRQEIKLHCYRILGSAHEAEDLVQETYLRAWRAFNGFEANGSARAWLYRIATNTCLNALDHRKRMQCGLLDHARGIADDAPDPETCCVTDEEVQLALMVAIQYLRPRPRAALLLCDVLGWATVEAATLLGGSIASINSALQRARMTLAKHCPHGRPRAKPSPTSAQNELLGRYLQAWEARDVDHLANLLIAPEAPDLWWRNHHRLEVA